MLINDRDDEWIVKSALRQQVKRARFMFFVQIEFSFLVGADFDLSTSIGKKVKPGTDS